jgi:hypothetical protein
MAKRPQQIEIAEYIISRGPQLANLLPPGTIEQARQMLRELWLPKLRQELMRTHPDHGGDAKKFQAAYRRYLAAKARYGL